MEVEHMKHHNPPGCRTIGHALKWSSWGNTDEKKTVQEIKRTKKGHHARTGHPC